MMMMDRHRYMERTARPIAESAHINLNLNFAGGRAWCMRHAAIRYQERHDCVDVELKTSMLHLLVFVQVPDVVALQYSWTLAQWLRWSKMKFGNNSACLEVDGKSTRTH